MDAKKLAIIDAFKVSKIDYFNQATIDKVWKASKLSRQEFVDIVWDMAQTDFIFDILAGRAAPHSVTAPKRGIMAWHKDQIELADMIRAKVPKDKAWGLLTFGYPRYLYLRPKYQHLLKGV